ALGVVGLHFGGHEPRPIAPDDLVEGGADSGAYGVTRGGAFLVAARNAARRALPVDSIVRIRSLALDNVLRVPLRGVDFGAGAKNVVALDEGGDGAAGADAGKGEVPGRGISEQQSLEARQAFKEGIRGFSLLNLHVHDRRHGADEVGTRTRALA